MPAVLLCPGPIKQDGPAVHWGWLSQQNEKVALKKQTSDINESNK